MTGSVVSAPTAISEVVIPLVLESYPTAQGIYLFGSFGTAVEWPESDVDIAVLLPPEIAAQTSPLELNQLQQRLARRLGRDVDLLNAREVSTVFQKAIIYGELIYCADQYAVDEFEMLTLSYYQKLNDERAGILESFRQTGRAYAV